MDENDSNSKVTRKYRSLASGPELMIFWLTSFHVFCSVEHGFYQPPWRGRRSLFEALRGWEPGSLYNRDHGLVDTCSFRKDLMIFSLFQCDRRSRIGLVVYPLLRWFPGAQPLEILHLPKLRCWTQQWRWMEDYFPFQRGDFQVPAVSFQGNTWWDFKGMHLCSGNNCLATKKVSQEFYSLICWKNDLKNSS